MPIRALPNGRPIPPRGRGRHRPKSVVAIDRNRWSSSIETTGRLQPKQLVAITRCAQCAAERTKDRGKPICSKGMPGVWLNRGAYGEGAV
jgi:hypothetical protein